ncbi:MAG TPA: hypothetical protein VKH34_12535 [Vicinamibacterales bacterium]|nr:hypothetical protein [Vicinamibacterales bacterium]
MTTRSIVVCACVSLALCSLSAAERPHFESKGLDGAITVDGSFDDWYGHPDPFGADPVAVQFLNDGDFLYVRLTASDAAARRQISRAGMTIWFDPAGGTKKKFGIRYPVVERGEGAQAGEGRGRGGRGRGTRPAPPPVGESGPPTERVDILGPGKDDARSLTRDHLAGVNVAIRAGQGTLQYELRVPLASGGDRPYAIGTAPGKTIGVGIETQKMQQPSSGSGRGGGFGGGGGGMGGGGGRGRGGGGGGGGGMGRGGGGAGQRGGEQPKPMKAWATVTIGPGR